MAEQERVVARFRDGRLVKGIVKNFRVDSAMIVLSEETTLQERRIALEDLKAIFFVKTFTGHSEHIERKAFGIRKLKGRKALVKFDDKETLVGFIDGDVPWDKGFSLEKLGKGVKGFFLTPVDGECNNEKVFVVGSSIADVTIMMV